MVVGVVFIMLFLFKSFLGTKTWFIFPSFYDVANLFSMGKTSPKAIWYIIYTEIYVTNINNITALANVLHLYIRYRFHSTLISIQNIFFRKMFLQLQYSAIYFFFPDNCVPGIWLSASKDMADLWYKRSLW